jgi:hypothetical protein
MKMAHASVKAEERRSRGGLRRRPKRQGCRRGLLGDDDPAALCCHATPNRHSLLVAGAVAAPGAAGRSAASSEADAQHHIVGRSKQWTASYITEDPHVMERILAEDSVSMGWLTDNAHAAARVGALRATGVRLVIDDFGAGYSSLS